MEIFLPLAQFYLTKNMWCPSRNLNTFGRPRSVIQTQTVCTFFGDRSARKEDDLSTHRRSGDLRNFFIKWLKNLK
jgi:hypothetical protein